MPKRLRLTEVRRLMLDENRNVTQASNDVGYESVSQFTHDYRKMFGASPKEDTMKLRRYFDNQNADGVQEQKNQRSFCKNGQVIILPAL